MKNVFKTLINVRSRDIDGMEQDNNAEVFTCYEEGRFALFKEIFQYPDFSSFTLIIVHIS